MDDAARLQSIIDLASARLLNGPLDPNVIVRLATRVRWHHYPEGMGEESRRLHREYNALVRAQALGVKNGAEVVKLTDECAAKGIVLVPGGEHW